MSQSDEHLHSLSSHPDWSINTPENVSAVDESEGGSPLLGQPAASIRTNAATPKLGFNAGDCAELVRSSDNSKPLVLIMAYGLTSLQGPSRCLGDLEVEPYKSHKPRSKIDCSNKDMAEEVMRRATTMNIKDKGKPPKPKNWKTNKLRDWLLQCPRLDKNDIDFLRAQEFALFTALANAAAENTEQANKSKRQAAWNSNEPFLRLYLCACDDRARAALLTKDALMDRQQLDARNNEARPLTFEEEVAKLFNDKDFLPCTESLPDLSTTFSNPIPLPFESMPGPITPDQVKSKLADARVRLMRIINRWETSGNGFGQIRDEQAGTSDKDKEDDNDSEAEKDEDAGDSDSDEGNKFDTSADVSDTFGHLIDENFQDGDNRQSFLWHHDGDKDHLLCFWHLLDSQGILSKAINKLDREVAVDCDSELPDVTQTGTRGQKRQADKEQGQKAEKNFRLEVGGALSGLTYQAMIENRDRIRRTVNEHRVMRIREQDIEVKEECGKMEEEAKGDLLQVEEQMVECEKRYNLKHKPSAKK